MSWLAAAGIGSSLLGGVFDFFGSEDASDDILEAYEEAIALQREVFERAKKNFKPFIEGGTETFNPARRLLGGDLSEFAVSPGFRLRQEEGERGVLRNLAAMGLVGSGRGLRDVTRFNQELAANEFGNFFNRNMQLAGLGQASAANEAAIGQNFATNTGNLVLGRGQAEADAAMNFANAFNSAFQNAGNAALLGRIYSGGGGTAGGGPLTGGPISVYGGGGRFGWS